MDAAIVGVLLAVIVVQLACIVVMGRQHERARAADALERERLTHLAVARDGREYAVIRKASAPKAPEPQEPAEEPGIQVGLG